MKNVIVDIGDISLHKEVYDTRPNRFFAIFIWGLFVMVVAALAWSYFGMIDIVVRASGVIRPYAQTATVVNAVAGEVTLVNFRDGMQVRAGDILYVIDTFDRQNELRIMEERLGVLNYNLETLNLYASSIEAGVNLIGSFNEEYSVRFDNFLVNSRALIHNEEAQSNLLIAEYRDLNETLSNSRFELFVLRLLYDSITTNEDLFDINRITELLDEYRVELDTIIRNDITNIDNVNDLEEQVEQTEQTLNLNRRNVEVFNTYRNAYLNYVLDIENRVFQIDNISYSLEGYITIRDSIETGQDLFETNGVYKSMYDEYIMKYNQLLETYSIALDLFERNQVLFSSGAISLAELNRLDNILYSEQFNKENFSANFMINIDNNIRDAENRLVLAENQKEMFRVSTIFDITSQIIQIENNVDNLIQRINQNELTRMSIFFDGDELGEVAIQRLGEINRTLNQISLLEQEITNLNLTMETIRSQIEEATVRAQIEGEISSYIELTGGSFLLSGVQVMTILPVREEMFTTNIFVSNNDIGKLEEGMLVRYNIPAMPRRDFGEITGYVTRISPDITVSQGVEGHFLVESELHDRVYYDTSGNGFTLRVGMAFDARIVTDRQRILFFILDFINLWFD